MSIPFLKKATDGTYKVHWSEGRRSRRQSLGTKELAAAERRFAKWLTMRGEISAEGAPSLTVAEYWSIYDERHVERETASPATLRQSWAKMEGAFGSLRVSDLTSDIIDKYVSDRERGRIGSPAKSSTIRRELGALIACLNWCAHPRRKPALLNKADIPLIDLPPEGEARDRWLTMGEIGKLLDAAATMRADGKMGRGERFLWLALETAARERAILDLTWDRVDFETGVIHYDVPGRKTTKKKRVSVPISKSLRPVLERMHSERINGLVLDSKSRMWASVQVIAERSGVVPPRTEPRGTGQKPKATGISPHVLRHTAATQMARRGVPLFDIAGILGNSLAMVEKVYAKHCPDRLRAAVNSISSGTLEAAE